MTWINDRLQQMRDDLGPDLWALALRAFKENTPPDQIAAGILNATKVPLSGLPAVFLKASVAWIMEAVHMLSQRQSQVRSERRRFRNIEQSVSSVAERLEARTNRALRKARFPCRWDGPRVVFVSSTADVNFSLTHWSAAPGQPASLPTPVVSVRRSWIRRVEKLGLASVHGKLNLDLESVTFTVPDHEAFKAIWVEVNSGEPRVRSGFLVRDTETGLVRYGASIASAMKRLETLTPDERERCLEAWAKSLSRFECERRQPKPNRIFLSPADAERSRAHLIWMGARLGGELGKLIVEAAEKGYKVEKDPYSRRKFTIRPIDSYDRTYYGLVGRIAVRTKLGGLPEHSLGENGSGHERLEAARIRAGAAKAGVRLRGGRL